MRGPLAQARTRRSRIERTGAELLLLMAFVLSAAVAVLASGDIAGQSAVQGDQRKPWAAVPIAATVTVVAPSKGLPGQVAEREIEVKQLSPLPFRELAGLVADLAGVKAVLQDRPGRVLDGDAELVPAVPFGLSMRGAVPEVLDELARLSGYDWGWEDGTLVFYRYGDIEQRRPERMPGGVEVGVLAALTDAVLTDKEDVDAEGEATQGRVEDGVPGELEPGGRPVDPDAAAAVEGQGEVDADEEKAEQAGPATWQVEADAAAAAGQGEAGAEVAQQARPATWPVDPEAHETVEGALRSWADRAGWQLAWESERQFKVGAAAEFPPGETEEAGFLAAADALLAISPMRRMLTATAYPNKWLVVRDLGSAGQ